MQNIAILGAGLSGRMLALLLKDHANVTLYDRHSLDDESATGRVAAAMIAPIGESIACSSRVTKMGLASTELWPILLSHLGLQVWIQQLGSVVVAHPLDESLLEQFHQQVPAQYQLDYTRKLDKSALYAMEPELASRFSKGIYLPTDGQIDNQQLFLQTASLIQQSDIELQLGAEVEIHAGAVLCQHKRRDFDCIVDCRGLGAKSDFERQKRPLRGVRGEVIRVASSEVKLQRPIRLMHPRYPLYIVPKPDGQFVIGATEIESESHGQVTVRSALELLSAAYSVHSGFAEAEILSMNRGFRPAFCDNEPIVQVTEYPQAVNQSRLGKLHIRLNGLYRHGFMLLPMLLSEVCEHILGHPMVWKNRAQHNQTHNNSNNSMPSGGDSENYR